MEYYLDNQLLLEQLESGRLSHAYLLEGEDQDYIGNQAISLAYNILTESGKNTELAHRFTIGTLVDLMVIKPERNTIKIEKIRQMIDYFSTLPLESKYQVVIIEDCQFLRKESANALLKTLEEPPKHGVIILTTTVKGRIIPTILSRCQVVSFQSQRKIDGEFPIDKLADILTKMLDKDIAQLYFSKDFFEKYKDNRRPLFDSMIYFFRDIMMAKGNFGDSYLYFPQLSSVYKKYIKSDERAIENIINRIQDVENMLSVNVNYRLSIEELLLYMMEEING